MKAYILGTGRSGTTLLYVLMQEIMSDNCRGEPHFYYEPFLRDIGLLDGRYDSVAAKMDLQESLSIEGMYQHLRLPLFVVDPAPFLDNSYLRSLFDPADGRPDLLIKFIRANGRFLLLRAICPQAKALFIIRNPLDVVNSIRQRFSFFGREFHRDDFPRFSAEAKRIYPEDFPPTAPETDVERELLFWYFMNRFALESFAGTPAAERPLLICYEEFGRDGERAIKELCLFLDVPYREKYLATARRKAGTVTRTFLLAESEQSLFREYLQKYLALLREYAIKSTVVVEDVLAKYRLAEHPVDPPKRFPGLHVRALEREYESLLIMMGASQKEKAKPTAEAGRSSRGREKK